jgi:hypothetical protein
VCNAQNMRLSTTISKYLQYGLTLILHILFPYMYSREGKHSNWKAPCQVFTQQVPQQACLPPGCSVREIYQVGLDSNVTGPSSRLVRHGEWIMD